MMVEAQAAVSSRLSPSCFLDLMVQVPPFPLIRSPSTMKPEPKSSEYSAYSTLLSFFVKTWLHRSSCDANAPVRSIARACATDLTDILSTLYDWLLKKQAAAIKNPDNACKAKVSMIAHSMGNYVLQKAMSAAWTRKNQPLLASLLNQLVMVAADVDNDLFDTGAPDNNDGQAIVNLTYRITALYSGRDSVLGMSAGLKHFGTRRLGRSGLAHDPPLVNEPPATDNVWDVDCSSFFPQNVSGEAIHGAYFDTDGTMELIRQILRGIDRGVLKTKGFTKGNAWPAG
jgi:hypothetical protein